MKKMTLAVVLLISGPLAVFADVSKEDLKKLCAAGISNDVILSYVRSNGPLVKLSAEEVVELRQAGANNGLLVALLSTPSPASTVSPVYSPPVAPSVTYVPPPSSVVYSTIPSDTSAVYDDFYPGAYYSPSYSAYGAPSFGIGCGYYGGRYCGSRYGNRYCGGFGVYGGTRFVGGFSTFGGHYPANFGGGHPSFGGHTGGGFGGGSGHGGGGGHGGHR